MTTQRVTLPIYELSCGGDGAPIVGRALAHTGGGLFVYVNPVTEMAYVEHDPIQVDSVRLVAIVKCAGFDAGTPSRR